MSPVRGPTISRPARPATRIDAAPSSVLASRCQVIVPIPKNENTDRYMR